MAGYEEIFSVGRDNTTFWLDTANYSKDFVLTIYDEQMGVMLTIHLDEEQAESLANVIKQELEDRFNKATEHY